MTDSPAMIREVRHAGNTLSYRRAGPVDGPVVLLVHGLASDRSTWDRVIDGLASSGIRVLAPDLLGHGSSDKPIDGYTLETFAASLASLLRAEGVAAATVVGHSFGGAVAMQLSHDRPELVSRLVLVSAGGLGRRVHPVLRAATLPGAQTLVRVIVNRRTSTIYRAKRLHRSLRLSPDVIANLGRAGRGLSSPASRAAFFATLRMAISPGGQRGSMLDLDYVSLDLPTLIVWSERDPVVPSAHAHDTHAHLTNSRLEIFHGSTHQPHHHSHERFVALLNDFIATT